MRKTAFKNLKGYDLFKQNSRPCGCLPQILLGPILEYFALYNQAEIPRLSLVVPYILHYYCILVLTKIIIRWCKNYTFIPDSIIYITVLYLLINFLWNYPTSLHSFYFPSLLCDSTTAVKCYKSITIGIWIY